MHQYVQVYSLGMKHIGVALLVPFVLVAFGSARYPRSMPQRMMRMKGEALKYQDQGMHHSAYISLGDSGRFTYWSVYEVGFDISLGQFSTSHDTMTLNWDSLATHQAVHDTRFYLALFAHSRPKPFKIDQVKYMVERRSLVLVSD